MINANSSETSTDGILDLAAPLLTSNLAISASAGTGKTFSLTVLTLRFILEGKCRINELLLMTFTVAATAEIKIRIIQALHLALRDLTEPDHVSEYKKYVVAQEGEREERIRRVKEALHDIDQLTVTTIDGFCTQMLSWVGHSLPGKLEEVAPKHVSFVLQTSLINHYANKAKLTQGQDLLTPHQLSNCFKKVTEYPDLELRTTLSPASNRGDTKIDVTRRILEENREWISTIRKQEGLVSFRDVQTRLIQLVKNNKKIRTLIQNRFKIVLLDEFQDTNNEQLDLFKDLFFDSGCHQVVIVGDPKQSIYGFRGADLNAFITASKIINNTKTLVTNYRSDENVVKAYNVLFNNYLFSESILADDIQFSKQNRIFDTNKKPLPAIHFRELERDSAWNKSRCVDEALFDAVEYIKYLLSSGIEIEEEGEKRLVQLDDIAVLLPTGDQINQLVSYLQKEEIPVRTNNNTVYNGPVAKYWITLLNALANPTDQGKIKLAMLTPFLGFTTAELINVTDDKLGEITKTIAEWTPILMNGGMQQLVRAISQSYDLVQNVVLSDLGHRGYTDLVHIAVETDDWLEKTGQSASPQGIASYITSNIQSSNSATNDAARLWLDRTSAAVEVMTEHRSKGLERPIVLLPLGWTRWKHGKQDLDDYFKPTVESDLDGLDSDSLSGPKKFLSLDLNRSEKYIEDSRYEENRLAYVTCTRAKHHLAIWHVNKREGGKEYEIMKDLLANALSSKDSAGVKVPDTFSERAKMIVAKYPQLFSYQFIGSSKPSQKFKYEAQPREETTNTLISFNRDIDQTWRRSSFSGLADSMAAEIGLATLIASEDSPTKDAAQQITVPLNDLPAGTQIGTAIHAIFEHLDFQAPDAKTQIQTLLNEYAAPLLPPGKQENIVSGLHSIITTPLGPAMHNYCLKDIPLIDRSDEMAFEFPVQETFRPGLLQSGETSTGVTPQAIGQILLDHLDADDPFISYATMLLEQHDVVPLHGYLLGFIDMVCAVTRPDGGKTYWIADYKTNRISPLASHAITLDYFSPQSMQQEMIHHHYPLQALIYQVALHRYLRQRISDYVPAEHLGGAAYLFLRGMIGPETPPGYGVVTWRISDGALEALDQLFTSKK